MELLQERPTMQRIPCPKVRQAGGVPSRVNWSTGGGGSAVDLSFLSRGMREKVKLSEFSALKKLNSGYDLLPKQ